MNLTQNMLDQISGKVCPYCGCQTKVISQEEIYGKRFGNGNNVICCVNYPRCDSYVGTHSDGTALGRLANYQLRIAKKKAHDKFDKIWKEKLIKRSKLYKMLSEHLKIPKEFCHIGMFQISTCYKVEDWAFKLYKELKNG